MLPKTRLLLAAVLAIAYVAGASRAADLTTTLKPGTPVTLQIQREDRLMYVSFTME